MSPAVARAGAGRARLGGRCGAVLAPSGRRAGQPAGRVGRAGPARAGGARAGLPRGAAVRSGAHLPVLTPRWWRQRAAAAPWGLRAGDPLEVVGHGAALGFPERLLVRRVADGQDALVFPAELAPPPPAAAGRRVAEEVRGEPVLEAV